jgi:hypothetical protein
VTDFVFVRSSSILYVLTSCNLCLRPSQCCKTLQASCCCWGKGRKHHDHHHYQHNVHVDNIVCGYDGNDDNHSNHDDKSKNEYKRSYKSILTTATSSSSTIMKSPQLPIFSLCIIATLSGFYMHYHSVGYGTHLQLEDAQAALKLRVYVDDSDEYDDDDNDDFESNNAIDDNNLNYNEA